MSNSSAPINVGEAVESASFGWLQLTVAILCGLVMVIDGYDLVAMGMVVTSLSNEWSIAPGGFGVDLVSPMSAALYGVLFGSAIAGYVADQVGRKLTVILMLMIASLFMALTSVATSIPELIGYRFLTGFGAGGSIPIAIALASEFAPKKIKNLMVIVTYSGAPFGAALGSFVGPGLIEEFGWQGIFYLGAIAPVIVCLLLMLLLPESVMYLVSKGKRRLAALKTLRAITGTDLPEDTVLILDEPKEPGGSFVMLFSNNRTPLTLLLWFVFFTVQFSVFYLNLWLPTVYEQAGNSIETALHALGNFNLGAFVGGVGIGLLADKIGPARALQLSFPIGALVMALLAVFSANSTVFLIGITLSGAVVVGSSVCLGPLAASLYPTMARSTGVGAGLGVGRLGSIIAPMIGAIIVAEQLGLKVYFAFVGVALVASFIGVLSLARSQNNIAGRES